jgi:hypothetical protein
MLEALADLLRLVPPGAVLVDKADVAVLPEPGLAPGVGGDHHALAGSNATTRRARRTASRVRSTRDNRSREVAQ